MMARDRHTVRDTQTHTATAGDTQQVPDRWQEKKTDRDTSETVGIQRQTNRPQEIDSER